MNRRHLAGLGLAATAGLGIAATGRIAAAQPSPSPSLSPPPPPSPGLSPSPSGAPPASPTAPPSPQPPPPGGSMPFTARRTELTLPDLPALGIPYVCLLDLFDQEGSPAGTATAGAQVVGVSTGGPVVLAVVVLHLVDGEIHYQRVMDRFGAFPRAAVGAILGGTGAYQDIRGEVDISWPDEETVDLVVRPAL